MLLIDMTSAGRRGPADRADRRRLRGQRGVVRATSGCPARTWSARRTAAGTTRSSCSATSGSASPRSARPSGSLARAKEPRPRTGSPTTRWLRARIAELENELLALELTALRVVAQLRRRQAAPGVVGAQAQGHRAAAGGQRAGRRPRRAGLAGQRRRATTPTSPWWAAARRRRSTSTSARPRSTAAPTRCSARSSPARSWDSERRTTMDFTYDDEQQALREAVRGLVGKAYSDFENRRQAVAEDPGFDEKLWTRMAEMGLLGLPFAEEDGGVGAGPVEVGIVCQELGRVVAPEPYLDVGRAGRRPGRRGRHRRAEAELLGALAAGESVLAFAHAEPGSRWSPTAEAVTADAGRRRLDADRRQGAGAARRPRRRARRERGAARRRHRPVPGRRRRGRAAPATRPTTAAGPPRSASTAPRRRRSGEPRPRRHREHRARCSTSPGSMAANEALGVMEVALEATTDVPQEPQAVRRHPQHLPGADVPGGRHVRLAGAGPQHRDWATMVLADGEPGEVADAASPGVAAGQPGRPAHRPGGDPAARRHRR